MARDSCLRGHYYNFDGRRGAGRCGVGAGASGSPPSGWWTGWRVAAWQCEMGDITILVSHLTRTFTVSPATACILGFFLSELLRVLRIRCLV